MRIVAPRFRWVFEFGRVTCCRCRIIGMLGDEGENGFQLLGVAELLALRLFLRRDREKGHHMTLLLLWQSCSSPQPRRPPLADYPLILWI
jgi:hypothetical protein